VTHLLTRAGNWGIYAFRAPTIAAGRGYAALEFTNLQQFIGVSRRDPARAANHKKSVSEIELAVIDCAPAGCAYEFGS
jgi:hypothetical protein